MPDQTREASKSFWARILPVLEWGPHYDRGWLRSDVIAGLTVAALVVPKSLGYAGIANVPIQHGLYAAAAGAILYALFGTSRQIATNPSSSLAAVVGSAMALTGISGDQDAVAFASWVALVCGLLFVTMTIFKMGWMSQFLSRAVIVGFLCGAALDVTVGELQKITGTEASGDNVWQEFWSWLGTLGEAHGVSVLVGGIALGALFGLGALSPNLPGTLIVVVGGLLASAVFDLGAHGVALVGDVPRGFPSVVVPDLDLLVDNAGYVITAAVAIVMIGFSQSAGDARAFATKHGYRVDIDQESLAQGISNIGAGVFQGIPVSTSLSGSSLNDHAGAKTQLASLVTGGAVVLTMLAFAPLFSDLPKPVLGAVIIQAVVMGMIDLPEFRRLYRIKRTDFWIAVVATVGVLLFGVLAGVVIGVILSVGWLVYTVTSPAMPVLGRDRGTGVFREIDEYPEDEQFPGIVIVSLDGGLFFATADALGDRLRELGLSSDAPPAAMVIDCRSVNFIDSQGSAQIRDIVERATAQGISIRLARVKPPVLDILERDGVVDQLGAENIHAGVNEAIRALRGQSSEAPVLS